MFDRIWFQCPGCEATLEHQSKAGPCTLADFQQEQVPVAVAADIVSEEVWCQACRRAYLIETAPLPQKTVPLRLRGGP